ncbi:unnamed protein product [Urochloa decumbens]|uniref:Uncharacterized protein n=1 Tax=Urochloa decumbens TaxID=240449 RepID=A0ABC8ZG68_9POAL
MCNFCRHAEGFSVAMSRGLMPSPEKMDRQRDCKIVKKIMNSACFYSPTAASDRHFYHASVNELHKVLLCSSIFQEGLFAKQTVGIFKCHWLKLMDITSRVDNRLSHDDVTRCHKDPAPAIIVRKYQLDDIPEPFVPYIIKNKQKPHALEATQEKFLELPLTERARLCGGDPYQPLGHLTEDSSQLHHV